MVTSSIRKNITEHIVGIMKIQTSSSSNRPKITVKKPKTIWITPDNQARYFGYLLETTSAMIDTGMP
jgi:hypothetical protein